jgi:hydroxypyruvate isomerase
LSFYLTLETRLVDEAKTWTQRISQYNEAHAAVVSQQQKLSRAAVGLFSLDVNVLREPEREFAMRWMQEFLLAKEADAAQQSKDESLQAICEELDQLSLDLAKHCEHRISVLDGRTHQLTQGVEAVNKYSKRLVRQIRALENVPRTDAIDSKDLLRAISKTQQK